MIQRCGICGRTTAPVPEGYLARCDGCVGLSTPEPALGDVLSELQSRGMLDRCTVIHVGNVEIRLFPKSPTPVDETPEDRARRERREHEETQYASS